MGSKTYFSLKNYYKKKKFPFANIYIASSKMINLQEKNNDIVIVKNLIYFLKNIEKKKKNLIIIGGSAIYKQSLPFVKKMFITHILRRYKGDKFFPGFDYNNFFIKDKKISNELIFATYIRK
jgi:dihydrofolate reductase